MKTYNIGDKVTVNDHKSIYNGMTGTVVDFGACNNWAGMPVYGYDVALETAEIFSTEAALIPA